MKKRNNNIDFLRGIATICIILIHTAFWSGELYLPVWFKNLTLIIDVPVFMFISGISFSYVNSAIKNVYALIKQWKKWLFFVAIYTIVILIFFRPEFSIKDFLGWLVYYFPNKTSLVVVQGSIWFWIMYIKVTTFCSIIININNYIEKDKQNNIRNLIYILSLILLVFIYSSVADKNIFIFDKMTLFFSIVYLLGYLSTNYKLNLVKTIIYEIIALLVTAGLFYAYRYGIRDIQYIKFSFSIAYLSFSMISIILFGYLKDRLKIKDKNPINYIGKNAIWFYFAQGISSSLLYLIYPYVKYHRYIVVFTIMLFLNIIMSFTIAILLEKAYNLFSAFFKKEKVAKLLSNIWPKNQ